MDSPQTELSIVLPCLNEERTVGTCVAKAVGFLKKHHINGEVLVADNGSTDRSVEIAAKEGARVVHAAQKGYGSALRGGFEAAHGRFIIMADADDSYDLVNLMPFVEKLREGYELVMGNRFKGGIKPGAMPWHHRYIGNPILSFIGKLFFKSPANDFHCGLRGFTKEAIQKMDLQTTGMELASEIVIKASILGMKTCEVPTTLSPDGRDRPPHLRSFRDGWRHLRFLLLYSPSWLFLYPGLVLTVMGGVFSLALFFGPVDIGFRYIDFHTFIAAGSLTYLGMNMISFAALTRIYAYNSGLLPRKPRFFSLFGKFNLETGVLTGSLLALTGLMLMIRAISLSSNFAQIGFDNSVRLVFGGALALVSGAQVIFTSFVLSMLGIKSQNR
ncbi:MAG: glycosyltransferase family 2 protein [Chloroflexi bacterium]|nr:glycosyltransferase family 2 protein [Chloroflexota bacterium]MDL1941538.1 glycosyltransferase family 2 protein [Chloroflexi bacterium CFX2]